MKFHVYLWSKNIEYINNPIVSEKTEQIWNRSQRREAAQSMKFEMKYEMINIDCLGTYDVE